MPIPHPIAFRATHRPATVLASLSLAFVVGDLLLADAACAQAKVQGTRVGTQVSGSQQGGSANVRMPDGVLRGRGESLGDGNALGGQTFRWSQTTGAGRASGSGNILDANTQLGSGGANAGSIPVDYGARNLIVTGSVPGGRGFRGSVGYTADTDFRGRTGSDDNYAFRADSAFSNPAFSASAVSRDRFLVAQGLGVFEYRRESTPLSAANERAARDQSDSRLRLDRANAQMSFARGNYDIGGDRTIISTTTQTGELVRYIISPLRGLQIENLRDPLARAGIGVYERARARQDIAAGLTTMDDYQRVRAASALDVPDPRRVDLRMRPQSEADRLRVEGNKVLPQSYLDIVDAVNKSAEAAGDGAAKPGEQPGVESPMSPLERVRESITPAPARPQRPGTTQTDAAKPATGDGKTDSTDSLISPDGTPRSGEADREAARIKERGSIISVDEAARILRHGRTIDSLSRDDRRRVDELAKQGEAALRAGDYFRAERRFEQAQALASDNPLAEAGIAHAQLGAGLYLSASLTLRNLFEAFPELIDAKYDRALLPAPERLATAVSVMRERIKRGDDVAGYGLILAYIGHQTADRAMVEEGLAAIAGNERLDTVRKLLEGVWLGAK
ncbi:MAG: hypothetical protein RL354_264 [Planctomycetota bacterium]